MALTCAVEIDITRPGHELNVSLQLGGGRLQLVSSFVFVSGE